MTRLTTIDSHLSHMSYWSPSFKSTEEQIVMEVFVVVLVLGLFFFFCLCFVWWLYSTMLKAYSGNGQWIILVFQGAMWSQSLFRPDGKKGKFYLPYYLSVPVLEFLNIRSSLIPIACLSHIRTTALIISNFVPKFVFLLFWPYVLSVAIGLLLLEVHYGFLIIGRCGSTV